MRSRSVEYVWCGQGGREMSPEGARVCACREGGLTLLFFPLLPPPSRPLPVPHYPAPRLPPPHLGGCRPLQQRLQHPAPCRISAHQAQVRPAHGHHAVRELSAGTLRGSGGRVQGGGFRGEGSGGRVQGGGVRGVGSGGRVWGGGFGGGSGDKALEEGLGGEVLEGSGVKV